jgi:hypothetical protein
MATYDPPNARNVPIWNPNNYIFEPDTALYQSTADLRYLKRTGDTATGAINFLSGIGLGDGTVSTPALSFINNSTTGIYRSGTDQLSISSAGVEVFRSSPTANQSFSRLLIPDGTVSAPSIAFISQGNTGIYRGATGSGQRISFATNGVQRAYIDNTIFWNGGNFFSNINGTVSAPAFSFTNATNSGLYRNAGDGSLSVSVIGSEKLRLASATNTSYNPLDMSNNALTNAPQVGNSAGNLEVRMNSTGAGGTLTLTGGTGLLAATAGGNSGQHLVLTINGVAYKIKLENV